MAVLVFIPCHITQAKLTNAFSNSSQNNRLPTYLIALSTDLSSNFCRFYRGYLDFLLFLSKTEEMCVWLIREKITLDKYRDTQSFELSYREIPVQCLLHKYTTRNQIYRKIKTLNFRYRRFLVYDKDFDDVGNA